MAGEGVEVTEGVELVRELNTRIREVGERLVDQDDYPLDFFCACGCWQTVRLTMAEYDALGAAPVYRPGHPIASGDPPPAG